MDEINDGIEPGNGADDASVSVVLALGGSVRIGRNTIPVSDLKIVFEAIGRAHSVQGLADALGLSYRAAWARLQTYEAALGRPLVRKTRGHGTELTTFGAALAETFSAAAGGLEAGFGRETRVVEHRLRSLLGTGVGRLSLAASHDPLLVETLGARPNIELSVMGSHAAVTQLLDGQVDAAGFHCGALAPEAAGVPFSAVNPGAGLVAHPLFEREQGLLLAPGNPLGIHSIADLAAGQARYVNRQKGSGTRQWFDRLLVEAGLSPAAIRGYAVEEFTHQAVAATIACGAADAGLGVRAAAEKLGLFFLSVGWETYYLAASRPLAAPAFDELIAAVKADVARTPGSRGTGPAAAA